jgi:hypothetical protein
MFWGGAFYARSGWESDGGIQHPAIRHASTACNARRAMRIDDFARDGLHVDYRA